MRKLIGNDKKQEITVRKGKSVPVKKEEKEGKNLPKRAKVIDAEPKKTEVHSTVGRSFLALFIVLLIIAAVIAVILLTSKK